MPSSIAQRLSELDRLFVLGQKSIAHVRSHQNAAGYADCMQVEANALKEFVERAALVVRELRCQIDLARSVR